MFPNTPVLSSFTGADENPLSEGGNWAQPTSGSGNSQVAQRLSNKATGTTAAVYNGMYWTPQAFDGQVVEVFEDIDVSGNSDWRIGLVQNPTVSASCKGYIFSCRRSDNNNRIYRNDGSATFVQIAINTTNIASGSQIGLSVGKNGNIVAYVAGVPFMSVIDTTYVGPWWLFFSTFDVTYASDNFGGGGYDPPIALAIDYPQHRIGPF